MRSRSRIFRGKRGRLGATLVEAAITLSVFVISLLAAVDLGLGVYRYHLVAEAARLGAREAIVHGSQSPAEMAAWDSAGAQTALATYVGPLLRTGGITMNTGNNKTDGMITVTYPGTPYPDRAFNAPGNLVQVTVTAPFTPLLQTLLGTNNRSVVGVSQMYIQH